MTRNEVLLVNDLDGSSAAETVSFGLDSRLYEVDLSKKNAAALRKAFASYVDGGHKAGRATTGRRGGGAAATGRDQAALIRV